MRYVPRSVRVGTLVSVIGVLLLGALAYRWRAAPEPTPPAEPGGGPWSRTAPVAIALVVVIASWASDSGGWREQREASGLSAVAARAWSEEAGAAFAAGALDPALDLLRKSIGRIPDDASLHYRLGLVQEARGDREAAARAFKRAAELSPDFEAARRALRRLSSPTGP